MTFEETQLLAELFAEIRTKLDNLQAPTPNDLLPRIEQLMHKEGDHLLLRLSEARPLASEPTPATPKQTTIQPQIIRVLPESLPQQEVRHLHVFRWGSWSIMLSLVGLLALSAVFGTLYFSSLSEYQRYRDSDTKYSYILSHKGIDSTALHQLELLFDDPMQLLRRQELEAEVDEKEKEEEQNLTR